MSRNTRSDRKTPVQLEFLLVTEAPRDWDLTLGSVKRLKSAMSGFVSHELIISTVYGLDNVYPQNLLDSTTCVR